MTEEEKANYKLMLLQAHQAAESAREDAQVASDMIRKVAESPTNPLRYEAGNCLCELAERKTAYEKTFLAGMTNNVDRQIKDMARLKRLLNDVDWPRIVHIVEMWNPSNDDLMPFKARQLDVLKRLTETLSK